MYENILSIVNNTNEAVSTENANKPAEVFSTQRDLIAGEVAKQIAMEHLLPEEIAKNHKEGRVHFHDLDYSPLMGMTNCALINLKDMLSKGFSMNNVKISKPRGIHTAMTLASQIVMAVGSSQYGGISFNRIDEVMAEYVQSSYDKLLLLAEEYDIKDKEDFATNRVRKEVYDACQTFEYQVNSMTCTSGQTPFLTINFGLGACWASRLMQEMLLKVREEGIGEDKVTAIFPKMIFTLKRGLNLEEGSPNYDIKQMALRCSSKRLYPDILNYDKVVEVTGSFKASMGCRSFLSPWYNEDGELQHDGRCNIGVTTLNLPLIALESVFEEDFFTNLANALRIAKDSCMFRIEKLRKVQAKSAPILYTQGGLMRLDPEEYVLPHLLARGSSISIGYIGLNETVNAMFPYESHILDSKVKNDFAIKVLKYINDKVQQYKDETGIWFSTYGTPSESQCKRMRDKAFDKFGEVAGVTDKEYFTNSFHLEAGKQTDVYSRMDFESQFVPFSSGGFIGYGELPDLRNNLEALENIWDFSYDVMPYYAINTPADQCFDCGFEGILESTSRGFRCPSCKTTEPSKLYAIRRVSGYLGQPSSRPFNSGKTAECNDRVLNM
ncbi:hypothetical protein KUA24_72 [Vibrio phage HNL01]|nr:hypothetical protein KUA24_72 [Vibrio phage HNL01]